jgi:hypothetical protein
MPNIITWRLKRHVPLDQRCFQDIHDQGQLLGLLLRGEQSILRTALAKRRDGEG